MSSSRVSIVTGASAGIGAAIARSLVAEGWPVALGARRPERLEKVGDELGSRGVPVLVRSLDVADPGSIRSFFEATERELGPVEVVVNNAGLCTPGLLHEVGEDDLVYEVAANLVGPMLLARRAVASMLAGGRRGDLVFVSSENAVRPRPHQVAYTATKSGLEGLARSLRMELEGTGIRSTIVRPGPTGTEFGRDWKPGVLEALLGSWQYWGVQRHLRWMPPEHVAAAVLTAVQAPPGTHLDEIQLMPEGPPRQGEP